MNAPKATSFSTSALSDDAEETTGEDEKVAGVLDDDGAYNEGTDEELEVCSTDTFVQIHSLPSRNDCDTNVTWSCCIVIDV